ncbi:factor-independent urate hydroxylase [Marinivivus vitaminiproducens]|uniref:factor-independent urate hydroxylase n=1 Tax=Marinivivus vitaminiproducens TaxID=3035935 RepID=UPI003FA12F89
MALVRNTYGKGQVRVMRVADAGGRQEVRELSVRTMLEGDFAAAYTEADNRRVVATDTIKNITYIVARETLSAPTEVYAQKLALRFLERYAHVSKATVTAHETKWSRMVVAGQEHPHGFVQDANGRPFAEVVATRDDVATRSGIDGYTFLKSTASGWSNFWRDEYTTLPETDDRICATAMDASWLWATAPADFGGANALVLSTMLDVFATTYSKGVQDSLYRMGEAALAAVPELTSLTAACPNKHYLPLDLSRFGLDNDNRVFVPTDEPHGQIECTVAR